MVRQAGDLSQEVSKDHVGGQGAELGILKIQMESNQKCMDRSTKPADTYILFL